MISTAPILAEWGNHFSQKMDLSHYKTILEVGCRQGKISANLAQQYPQQKFIAMDNVESVLEQANQVHFSNLQFIHQDARCFSFKEQFDAVVSFNNCFMWIKEKQIVLKNIYTALKPGGKAYLQFFVRHGQPKNDRFLYLASQKLEWRSYFKKFVPDYYEVTIFDFCRALHQTGFVIHKLELMHYPTRFEEGASLHEFFKSWATQVKYVPTAKQDHFLNDVTELYLNFHHYLPNESFEYFEYVLEVICEKPLTSNEDDTNFQYGTIQFSKREAQVLKYFLLGKTAKEVGLLLDLSAKTVEFHLGSIKEKCHCIKRSDLYKAALDEGFISLMFDEKLMC